MQCAGWIFLEKKSTLHPAFCKDLKRKRCRKSQARGYPFRISKELTANGQNRRMFHVEHYKTGKLFLINFM
jgi:hypothetical protein